MSEKTLQFKRGTAARWSTVNPVLAKGEPGFVYDKNKIKIGDGVTPWNQLPYFEGSSGIESVSTFLELPAVGSPSIIYRVIDEKSLYQYNTETRSYDCITASGSGIENIELINGGNA